MRFCHYYWCHLLFVLHSIDYLKIATISTYLVFGWLTTYHLDYSLWFNPWNLFVSWFFSFKKNLPNGFLSPLVVSATEFNLYFSQFSLSFFCGLALISSLRRLCTHIWIWMLKYHQITKYLTVIKQRDCCLYILYNLVANVKLKMVNLFRQTFPKLKRPQMKPQLSSKQQFYRMFRTNFILHTNYDKFTLTISWITTTTLISLLVLVLVHTKAWDYFNKSNCVARTFNVFSVSSTI